MGQAFPLEPISKFEKDEEHYSNGIISSRDKKFVINIYLAFTFPIC